jgi:hypothetical protein
MVPSRGVIGPICPKEVKHRSSPAVKIKKDAVFFMVKVFLI